MAEGDEKVVEGENDSTNSLPESFPAEFGNAMGSEISGAISHLGFNFERQSTADEEVVASGKRGDGTTIIITIKKGMEYKSPAEKEREYNVQERRRTFCP